VDGAACRLRCRNCFLHLRQSACQVTYGAKPCSTAPYCQDKGLTSGAWGGVGWGGVGWGGVGWGGVGWGGVGWGSYLLPVCNIGCLVPYRCREALLADDLSQAIAHLFEFGL